jgi:serine/threonine-protein kinase HipA
MTTLELARAAGIRVPAATHHRTGPETSVIVLDRFDRPAEGGRTGFMSADSLLEKRVDEVVSYVDLVDALGDVAQEARTERLELFRRVAFVLLVNDVDDHMKNHALLRGRTGWRLSPSYDVNPWPRSWLAESTPVAPGGVRTARSVEELVEQAAAFGLTTDEAVGVVVDVDEATRPWARVAEHHGVEDPAGSVLASAFEGPDRALVARWRR